jgi:integrase
MATHLTDAIVRRLPTPAKGKVITLDDEVTGFGLRVTAAGARSFVLRYTTRAGRERTYTIGSAEAWKVTTARAKARTLRRDVEDGGDPLGDIEAERAAPTVWELIARFEAEHLPRCRPNTAIDYRRMIAKHVRPHFSQYAKVADVRFEDIDALHRKITHSGSPFAANRCIAITSKMFALAVRWHMRTDNPARGVEPNAEHGRRRYLSGDELARLVAALAAHPDREAADILRILLLTGCRKSEALSMKWGDIDLATGTWSKPPSSTKQGRHHEAPLSAPARALLSRIREGQVAAHPKQPLGTFVFPGPGEAGHRVELKRQWRTLCKAAGITGLRLHDLRHSYASALVSGGASLPLIGALLGHSNPATTNRYSHLYDDPLRAAAERIGRLIENAGTPPPAPPIPLRRGGQS